MQTWPELYKIEKAAAMTVFSRGASSKTSKGLLPPSSKLTSFKLDSAEALWMARPVATEPVNEILLISMCLAMASPQGRPNPFRMFKTPLGRPIFWHKSPTTIDAKGDFSDDFTTIVLPAARAGPSLVTIMNNGAFHGIMPPHTPY